MTYYKVYKGEQIFNISEEDEPKALIEGLLYERDHVMIIGPPKITKSVLTMQICCSLSSGTPFLDTFDTPKAVKVLYIATEGKEQGIRKRFIRLATSIPTVKKNLNLVWSPSFKFNTERGKEALEEIKNIFKEDPPKVIVVDSLYMAIAGSLKNDDVVNDFNGIVREFSESLNAALVVIHHTKKMAKDHDGNAYQTTDDDSYGSQFLLSVVDHCIRLEFIKKENAPLDRYVRCDTQRSGEIIKDFRIRLKEPDPLYFISVDNNDREKDELYAKMLKWDKEMNQEEIRRKSGIGRTKLYQVLGSLGAEGKVVKSGGKVKYFKAKEEGADGHE